MKYESHNIRHQSIDYLLSGVTLSFLGQPDRLRERAQRTIISLHLGLIITVLKHLFSYIYS